MIGPRFSAIANLPQQPPGLSLRVRALAFCFIFALLFNGCGKGKPRRPSVAQTHKITQELAAASASTPRGTRVKVRQSTNDYGTIGRDELRISIPASSAELPSIEAKLVRNIGAIATRHRMTQDSPLQTGNTMSILLRLGGTVTHEIEIEPLAETAASTRLPPGTARLAIILDDLGADRAAAESIFALGYPLTISVLPGHEHSAEIASEAHHRGLEVMLHLPMQAAAGKPEPEELHAGMNQKEVAAMLNEFLERVPDAVGVNNHQGSQATADSDLMRKLMPALHERRLFYVDSRTTAATVAFETAKQAGVPAAFRNVPFLDDAPEVAAVRKQLQLAFHGAHEKGEALAIGHPHPATIEALRELLPQAQPQGIQLVFASDLAH